MKKSRVEVQAALEVDALKVTTAVFTAEKELKKILFAPDNDRDDLNGIKELWHLYFALKTAADKADAYLDKI